MVFFKIHSKATILILGISLINMTNFSQVLYRFINYILIINLLNYNSIFRLCFYLLLKYYSIVRNLKIVSLTRINKCY